MKPYADDDAITQCANCQACCFLRAVPPDPDEQNDSRAAWAHAAILAFERETQTDREDALCDLLCDLMHWADRAPFSFSNELDRARQHYAAETDGESN